jgi:co-chaperonin GroES (HSP10)
MEDKETIDQSVLAEDVASKIKYDFLDFFLVKPLDPIKVTKEFSKPVSTGTPVKDANGVEAQDFDKVETEVKEVNSDYRKGVVIKRPMYFDTAKDDGNPLMNIKPGDIVIFRDTAGLYFDLIKDSKLIRMYDILGIEKTK